MKEQTVTSIVKSNLFCTKHKKRYKPNQTYIDTMKRIEEIQSKGNFLEVIKIEL